MATRGELIAGALQTFLSGCPDVDGVAVVSADGLPMASALPDDIEEERLAAMSASMLSLGERATSLLRRGDMRQLFIEGDHGFVYVMAAGDNAVVCAICRPSAKTGLILYEMKTAARAIARALSPVEEAKPADPARPVSPVPDVANEPATGGPVPAR